MNTDNLSSSRPQWHHKPPHRFVPGVIYMVTAGTWRKQHLFRTHSRLQHLHDALRAALHAQHWVLHAWAVFSNHYHFIAQAPGNDCPLKPTIQRLHSQTARHLNHIDQVSGRRVWFQYWDTCITFERSYYARINYVHQNPVKHGIVADAREYPFCSAAWFAKTADPGFVKKVASFGADRLEIVDDFDIP